MRGTCRGSVAGWRLGPPGGSLHRSRAVACGRSQCRAGSTSSWTPVDAEAPGGRGGEASCVDKRCAQKQKRKEDTLSLILAVCATLCEHRRSFPRSDTGKPQQSHHCVLPQSNISLGLSGVILATLFSGSPLCSSTRRCYPFAARATLSLQRRGNTEVSAPTIDRPVFTSPLFLVGGSQQRYKSMKTSRRTTTTTAKRFTV